MQKVEEAYLEIDTRNWQNSGINCTAYVPDPHNISADLRSLLNQAMFGWKADIKEVNFKPLRSEHTTLMLHVHNGCPIAKSIGGFTSNSSPSAKVLVRTIS